jgi:molybdenum cofactor cytidylyltransferase
MGVGALVLAAGESRRLGTAKQLLRIEGETLVSRAVRNVLAAGFEPVIVVLGAHAPEVEAEIRELPVQRVINQRWRNGLGTSIATGIGYLLQIAPETEAVLITLCDQPHVRSAQLSSLLRAFEEENHPVVAAGYAGEVGVPAIFHRTFFPDLLALEGERGARSLLQSQRRRTRVLPIPEAAFDVDTPNDVRHFVSG